MNSRQRYKVLAMMVSIATCCAVVSVSSAANSDGMAFSAELLTGQQDDVDVRSLYATVTTPPDTPLMVHIEAVSDDADGDSLQGVGAHLYYQKNWGLAGITAMQASVDLAETGEFPAQSNLNVATYGFELEGHLASVALALQGGRIDSDDIDFSEDYYESYELHWFATRQWHVVGGSRSFADETTNFIETDYSYFFNSSFVSIYLGSSWVAFENSYLGLEYSSAATSKSNWTVFLEYNSGEDSYDAAFIGVRYEFGPVEAAPILSLFDRNTGGYSFVSSQSSGSQISKGMGKHE